MKWLGEGWGGDGHCRATGHSGKKGIESFTAAEKRGEPFAVVITDLGMPHVDARKVAAAVKAVSPATPVIFLTGWGQRLMAHNHLPPHVDRLLPNPPPRPHFPSALSAPPPAAPRPTPPLPSPSSP